MGPFSRDYGTIIIIVNYYLREFTFCVNYINYVYSVNFDLVDSIIDSK